MGGARPPTSREAPGQHHVLHSQRVTGAGSAGMSLLSTQAPSPSWPRSRASARARTQSPHSQHQKCKLGIQIQLTEREPEL
ncbi:hypothetical protein NDU88_002077 [Pleurodeles waltl]|uniref:Uncharacterized protein n=1 Tax=Pleurodeles waltl TaxID=8319 RepID=A0AAV7UW66_PLEWA|nr:hypothetical protein NDU88_002077 [Pleurodeles waltl]